MSQGFSVFAPQSSGAFAFQGFYKARPLHQVDAAGCTILLRRLLAGLRCSLATMRVLFLFGSLLVSAFTLIGEEASSPLITVRKGTSIIVQSKDIRGPTASSFSAQATEKTGGVVLQKSYAGDTRHAVHQFTDDLVETLTGQKGIALSKMAFVSDRSGCKCVNFFSCPRILSLGDFRFSGIL